MSNSLTLHHLDHSQSQRILWLLCELSAINPSLTYTIVPHFRTKGEAPSSLKAVSPTGKAPLLVLPDGRKLNESIPIIDYLLKTYDTNGVFSGAGQEGGGGGYDWLRDEELTSYASSSLGFIVQFLFIIQLVPKLCPFFIRPLFSLVCHLIAMGFADRLKTSMQYLEDQLSYGGDATGEVKWFTGDRLGKADFTAQYPVDVCFSRGLLEEKDYPKVAAWKGRCEGREAWKKGLSEGNGYDFKKAF